MSLHVSSTVVLIIRKSKFDYTASGIITNVGGRPVHRLRDDGHLQSVTIPDAVLYNFDLLMMSTKVLETCRGIYWTYYKTRICALLRLYWDARSEKHQKISITLKNKTILSFLCKKLYQQLIWKAYLFLTQSVWHTLRVFSQTNFGLIVRHDWPFLRLPLINF